MKKVKAVKKSNLYFKNTVQHPSVFREGYKKNTMIQRLQTLWLLFASAMAFITLKVSFFSGNKLVMNDKTYINEKQFVSLTGMSNMIIMVLTVGIAIASLVSIFLYNDRKMQLKITAAIVGVSIINIVLYYLQTKNFIPGEGTYVLTSLLVFCIPAFLLMAIRGIYKDEKLIKSVDRLR